VDYEFILVIVAELGARRSGPQPLDSRGAARPMASIDTGAGEGSPTHLAV
jgi:hypothetical protein